MKQKMFYLILTSFALVFFRFIMTGFKKITDGNLESFDCPPTNDRLNLRILPAQKDEHIRKLNIRHEDEGKIYLECISTFTSDKLTIGRREDFIVPIDKDSTMIAINRNENCYEVILEKDESGNWVKPQDHKAI